MAVMSCKKPFVSSVLIALSLTACREDTTETSSTPTTQTEQTQTQSEQIKQEEPAKPKAIQPKDYFASKNIAFTQKENGVVIFDNIQDFYEEEGYDIEDKTLAIKSLDPLKVTISINSSTVDKKFDQEELELALLVFLNCSNTFKNILAINAYDMLIFAPVNPRQVS
ncbi:hypothetical protein ACE4RU_07730 [Actinobacillus seminis]|uniref:hypothetical protein n=1 Tax=Actinobacillus seminis TaxID=722 RepID=UPI003B93CBA7